MNSFWESDFWDFTKGALGITAVALLIGAIVTVAVMGFFSLFGSDEAPEGIIISHAVEEGYMMTTVVSDGKNTYPTTTYIPPTKKILVEKLNGERKWWSVSSEVFARPDGSKIP